MERESLYGIDSEFKEVLTGAKMPYARMSDINKRNFKLIKQKLIKKKLNLLPIIQSIHFINSNIGNTAQNGCLKL